MLFPVAHASFLHSINQNTPNLNFIETMTQLLDKKEAQYQTELYVNDKLHFNEKGYKRWAKIIRDVLDKDFEKK
jgi:lysophospholipase L1-like esterase